MYLQKLRELQVGIGNWPTDTLLTKQDFDAYFDVVDSVLNSWKEAHEIFDSVKQQGISPLAMASFGMLVRQALGQQEPPVQLDKYPQEVLTYGLLREWLDVDREEQRLQRDVMAGRVNDMSWEQAVLEQGE